MIDEQLILSTERLRDDLGELKRSLRRRCPSPGRQVTAEELKKRAAQLAEVWMVELVPNEEVVQTIGSDLSANLNVHFQRLLSFSEHASTRSRYDTEIAAILRNFTTQVVIPLKQLRQRAGAAGAIDRGALHQPRLAAPEEFSATAFVGMSFADQDRLVNSCVIRALEALGVKVATGEKPRAERISEKVKKQIEGQYLFVGVFTKRDKISAKEEWTTSSWVVDEKAYAFGKGKKLILLKETGVGSIGGIQGDYEFIEFSRRALEKIPLSLMQIFKVSLDGLQ